MHVPCGLTSHNTSDPRARPLGIRLVQHRAPGVIYTRTECGETSWKNVHGFLHSSNSIPDSTHFLQELWSSLDAWIYVSFSRMIFMAYASRHCRRSQRNCKPTAWFMQSWSTSPGLATAFNGAITSHWTLLAHVTVFVAPSRPLQGIRYR